MLAWATGHSIFFSEVLEVYPPDNFNINSNVICTFLLSLPVYQGFKCSQTHAQITYPLLNHTTFLYFNRIVYVECYSPINTSKSYIIIKKQISACLWDQFLSCFKPAWPPSLAPSILSVPRLFLLFTSPPCTYDLSQWLKNIYYIIKFE